MARKAKNTKGCPKCGAVIDPTGIPPLGDFTITCSCGHEVDGDSLRKAFDLG